MTIRYGGVLLAGLLLAGVVDFAARGADSIPMQVYAVFGRTAPASGVAVGAKATTSAPTYTNNTFNPLSVDASGALRVAGSFSSAGAADTTGTGTLGSLNATVSVAMAGQAGCGFHLDAGTLIGTLTPEISNDGGTTWVASQFADGVGNLASTVVFASSNPVTERGVQLQGGTSHCRVRVSAYTSGTAAGKIRSTVTGAYVSASASSNASVGSTGAGVPASATYGGMNVGGNLTGFAGTANGLKVDGSAATQPVSGTFWQATQPVSGTVTTTPPSNASTNVTQWAGTAVDVNSGTKSAGTVRVVIATDQPALTNKLLVTPDSVALPANQSVNVNQLAGTTTDTNSGVKSAGTLRVVLATDQPALTNKLLVTPDSVALPANQSVNVSQINGVTPLMGSGVTGTGSPRISIATDANLVKVSDGTNTAVVTAASTAPVTGSAALTVVESPNSLGCAGQKLSSTSFKNVSITANTQVITGTSSQNVYICHVDLVTAAANNVAIVEGTGTVCATGTAGMWGGTTAATGWNLAANGGIATGDGMHAIGKTATQADNVCIFVSAAVQLSGSITWVSF